MASVKTPDWWVFTLLALASWRTWTLFASDKILERPMDAFYRRLRPQERRTFWREFVECPRCFGAWVALAWFLGWLAFPTEATIFAIPWALSAAVIFAEMAKEALAD